MGYNRGDCREPRWISRTRNPQGETSAGRKRVNDDNRGRLDEMSVPGIGTGGFTALFIYVPNPELRRVFSATATDPNQESRIDFQSDEI